MTQETSLFTLPRDYYVTVFTTEGFGGYDFSAASDGNNVTCAAPIKIEIRGKGKTATQNRSGKYDDGGGGGGGGDQSL